VIERGLPRRECGREVYRVASNVELAADAATATHQCLGHNGVLLSAPEICTIVSGDYSADRSTIILRMQARRRSKAASETPEQLFGAILREIRKERGFSQETLAFESGYHTTYIGQLERGQKSPSLRTIMNLAGVLSTPGSEMLRRVESHLARSRR
jgi:DNA-binding XRE family transcriptional regulator